MEKVKIGEYVRTPEDGYIGQLVNIIDGTLNYYEIDIGRKIRHSDGYMDNYIYSRDGLGLKHSYEIKNLLEIGDSLEFDIDGIDREDRKTYKFEIHDELDIRSIQDNKNAKITKILTHEQYEANCYKEREE